MNRIVLTSLIGTAAAAALAVGAVAPAFASSTTPTPTPSASSSSSSAKAKTPRTLDSVQAAAKSATAKRETALSAAITKLDAAKGVSASDKSVLLGRLDADLAAMKTVEAKVAADTTVATASKDYTTIFSDYRVFGVAIPQARVVAGVDRATSMGIPRLSKSESKLAALLAGNDKAKSTATLQADLADMKSRTAAANSALSGVSAKALAITPSQFDSNKTIVKSIRTSVKAALADLKKVRADRKAIVAALK